MIHILHLSDLHFFQSTNWNNMKAEIIRVAREKFLRIPEKQKLLILTGDFRNYYDVSDHDFKRAEDFLNSLINAMNIDPKEDVFLVPGNHDVDHEKPGRQDFINYVRSHQGDEINWKRWESCIKFSFEHYNRFVSELGCYEKYDKEKQAWIPSMVHVRSWRDKLNILHLDTALATARDDKDNDRLQCVDTYTATSDEIRGKLREGNRPSIAIAHHNFNDLEEKSRKALLSVFRDGMISAYCCGDRHRPGGDFDDDRKIKISNSESIPIITGYRGTSDERDTYSKFGFFIYEVDEILLKLKTIPYVWSPDKNYSRLLLLDQNEEEYQTFPLRTFPLQRKNTKVLYTIGNINLKTVELVAKSVKKLNPGVIIERIVIFDSEESEKIQDKQIQIYRKYFGNFIREGVKINSDGSIDIFVLCSVFSNKQEKIIDLSNGQKLTTSLLFMAASLLQIEDIYYLMLKTSPKNDMQWEIDYEYKKIRRDNYINEFSKISYFDIIYYNNELMRLFSDEERMIPGPLKTIYNGLRTGIKEFFTGGDYRSVVNNVTIGNEKIINTFLLFLRKDELCKIYCEENGIEITAEKDPVGILTYFSRHYSQNGKQERLLNLVTIPNMLASLREYRNISAHYAQNGIELTREQGRIIINMSFQVLKCVRENQEFWNLIKKDV